MYGYPDTFSFQSSSLNVPTSTYNTMTHRCIDRYSPILQYICLEAAPLSSLTFSLNMSTTTFGYDNTPYIFIRLHSVTESSYVDLRFEMKELSLRAKLPMFAQLAHIDKNILIWASKKLLFKKDSIIHIQPKTFSSLSNLVSKQWIEVNLSVDVLMDNDNDVQKFEWSTMYNQGPLPQHIHWAIFALNYEYILNISFPLGKNPSLVFLTQGNVRNLTYSCKIMNHTCAFITNADISWIKNSFRSYVQHNSSCFTSCQCVDILQPGSLLFPDIMSPYLFAYCINFSSVAKGESYFHLLFFREAQNMRDIEPFLSLQHRPGNNVLVSWKEASRLCRSVGGTLPVFRSRVELNQLLSILKFSPILPILEAFFVGLFQGICAQRTLQKCKNPSQKGFIWETGDPMVFQKWKEIFLLSKMTVSSNTVSDYRRETHKKSLNQYVRSFIDSKHYIHPHISKECVAMIVHNLVDPIWVSTNCNDRWVSDTFCMVRVTKTTPSWLHNATNICERTTIKNGDLCLKISWFLPNEIKDKCLSLQQKNVNDISPFLFVFEAAGVTFPPVLLHRCTKLLSYMSMGNIVQFQIKEMNTVPDQFISLKTTPQQIVTLHGNIFQCDQNVSISFTFVCDGYKDCPGEESSDELNCPLSNGSVSCPAWFYVHIGMKCFLPFSLRPLKIQQKPLMSITTQNCSSQKLLSCTEGCFDFADICLFKHHGYNMIPCKRGEHIQSCKQFQCNTKFKCPGFYCIPWNYTCDGMWDCPDGTDESETNLCYNNRLCHGAFKCYRTHRCIHLADTCNGNSDCAFGDDELFCSLSSHMCPKGCTCLLFAAQCYNMTIHRDIMLQVLPYETMILKLCSFSTTNIINDIEWTSIKFSAVYCKLETICASLKQMEHLIQLNVGFNSLRNITNNCFKRKSKLKLLELNNNLISKIQDKGLWMLSSLIFLNLSNNKLKQFDLSSAKDSKHFILLSLVNCSLHEVKSDPFEKGNLVALQVDKFEMCCFIPSTAKCTVPIPSNITCTGILPNIGTKVSFTFISIFLILSNIASMILQKVVYNRGKLQLKTYPLIVVAVNIADILLSVPLHILWIADKVFLTDYILNSYLWQASPVCCVAYFVFLFFSLVSPSILCMLAYSKFSVVKFPIESKFKQTRFVRNVIFLCYCTPLSYAVGLTLVHILLYDAIPNKLCLPFTDNKIYSVMPLFVIILCLCTQILALCCISFVLWNLVHELKASQKAFEGVKMKKKVSISLLVQIFVTIGSHLLCWIPSGTIFMAGLLMENFPSNLLVWALIWIFPLNSNTNPVVFISTTARKLL